jgi:uncharacterized membrane protein SpoIIM required for sporulation/uncharacterized RDD family membrane protein YckC
VATVAPPTLEFAAPERVLLELPVAGLGPRAIAYLVDVGLLFMVGVTAYFAFTFVVADPLEAVLGLTGQERLFGVLVTFGAVWGYWTALEVAWQGQTIGKRLARVRVVRADGAPVTLTESALRNLLRIVDFLPFGYVVGLVAMGIDPHHRRLGDLVAGTVVIRDEPIDLSKYDHAARGSGARMLSPLELELLTGLLARWGSLELTARQSLGRQVATTLGLREAEALGDEALRRRLESAASAETSSVVSDFVVARSPDWATLGVLLTRQRQHTLKFDELLSLDRLHRRASADLARARAFFAGTDVTRHLNQLCGRAHAAIYQAPPNRLAAVRAFFASTFPQAVQATLPYSRAAGVLLGLGAVLGAVTVGLDPHGYRALVDASLRDFIDRGALWTDSVLDQQSPSEMATIIFTNNLRVSFTAFALGITAGLGSVVVLVTNGVQLGATLTACFQHGVGFSLLDFMAAHGPLELSLIGLTGGAGLVIGHALIDPEDHPRGEWLRQRATLAVQLVLGCAPCFVAIGLVEGFVSPGTFVPWPLKALLGVSTVTAFWRWALKARVSGVAS